MSYFTEIKVVDKTTGVAAGVDSENQFKVVLTGKIDTGNSSATPLLAAAAFTGVAVDVLNYNLICVSVFSNVVSATDGLSIQQSSDGTNWDFVDTYTVNASDGKILTFQPACKYFRIVYTNGAGDQAAFRLQTVLKMA